MCGRFAFYSPSEATAALFGVDASTEVVPRYNIAPTQYVAAIRLDEGNASELVMLRWGAGAILGEGPVNRQPDEQCPV